LRQFEPTNVLVYQQEQEMLKAFRNLVWGASNSDDNNNSASGSGLENSQSDQEPEVSEPIDPKTFHTAVLKIKAERTDFLQLLPISKLRYRIPQGEHAGSSYLWYMGEDAFRGNPFPLETVSEHITLNDLRTKPNNDHRTLLWLVTCAAYKGNANPLDIILKNCGMPQFEDLEVKVGKIRIRNLLKELAKEKMPQIKEYIPALFIEEGADDDSDLTCYSEDTFNDYDEDLDVTTTPEETPKQSAPILSRTHSQGSLHGQVSELRAWKRRQNQISNERTANDDDDNLSAPKSVTPPTFLRMHSQSSILQNKHLKAQKKRENAKRAQDRNAPILMTPLISPRPTVPAPAAPAAPAVSTSTMDTPDTSRRFKR
jgi:hypothetical protein